MTPCVGLDLSLTSTGIALPDGDLQRIRSAGKKTATYEERADRLGKLTSKILRVVYPGVGGSLLVCLEGPAYGMPGGSTHDRAGLWWMVYAGLRGLGASLAVVSPKARSKYATGKGTAAKDEVLAATVRRFPTYDVDGNDVADALILRAMGCEYLGSPLVSMPVLNADALTKVEWPKGIR